MTFDDAKRRWHEENSANLRSQPLRPSLAELAIQRGVAMRRKIIHRDMAESIAAVLVIAIFAPLLYVVPSWTSKAGAAMIVIGAIVTIVVLHHTRRRPQDRQVDQSVRDCCQSELTAVERQIRILKSVLWWYILPLLGGAALFFAGHDRWGFATAINCSVLTGLGVWLFRINQRVVTTTLIPLRDELVNVLHDLENHESD